MKERVLALSRFGRRSVAACCFGTTPNRRTRLPPLPKNKHGQRAGAGAAVGASVRAARLKLRFWLVKGKGSSTKAGASPTCDTLTVLTTTLSLTKTAQTRR